MNDNFDSLLRDIASQYEERTFPLGERPFDPAPICWACRYPAMSTASVGGSQMPACDWHVGTWRPLGSGLPFPGWERQVRK